jgi:hypothetical protein
MGVDGEFDLDYLRDHLPGVELEPSQREDVY